MTFNTVYTKKDTLTLEDMESRADIHTLAKQMVNNVSIIERHFIKVTATIAANRLA